MICKYYIQNASERLTLNNPDEKTACGCFDSEAENSQCSLGKCKTADNQRLGETRSLLM